MHPTSIANATHISAASWINDSFLASLPQDILVSNGAKDAEKILSGQWWRLLTSMWLHGGFIHLGMNLLAIYKLGGSLEMEFGTVPVAVIYLTSGVFGTIVSAIFLPWQVGVGASGAIFGLFGSCWADMIANWGTLEGSKLRAVLGILIPTILNLGFGTTLPPRTRPPVHPKV